MFPYGEPHVTLPLESYKFHFEEFFFIWVAVGWKENIINLLAKFSITFAAT